MYSLINLLALLILTGCAVGPLMLHETARTVGKSHSDFAVGAGNAGFFAKWNYGLLENLDLGLQWESMSIGVRAKYALIKNDSNGFSMALALGTGSSVGGSHNYGDLIVSYLTSSFEPYLAYRYVKVKTDPVEFKDKNSDGKFDFTINGDKYSYDQAILGFRIWLSNNWIFTAEGARLQSRSSALKGDAMWIGSGGFGYRFQ